MTTIHVIPAPNRLVRHPETGEVLPKEGMTVPRTSYWLRRLREGDVLLSGAAAPAKKPAKSKEE